MNQFFKNLNKNVGVQLALYLVIAFIAIDTFITYQYKQALSRDIATQTLLDEIASNKEKIISNLNNIDMSLRGYLLVQNEAFIGTFEKIKSQSAPTMAYLQTTLPQIGIPSSELSEMNLMLNNYFKLMDKVIVLSKEDKMNEALAILKEDHGTAVWQTYVKLSAVIDPVIKDQKLQSHTTYNKLLNLSLIFQVVLFVIGIPTLLYAAFNLVQSYKTRIKLFTELDKQNRSLLFDSNQKIDIRDGDRVIGDIIINLNKTADFIKAIGQGNYDVKWEGFSAASASDNQHAISGELLAMREEMKKKSEQGIRQQWVSEGLNKLTEIIRNNQNNLEVLSEKTVFFIVKYLKAQQGGLFVLNDENEEDRHLYLISCYAFDRKKFIDKRIELGEGILGQTFLEGEPVYLTNIPQNYTTITSGLGESNPSCISIHPMKHDEQVVALLEIASFNLLDQHALDFLTNACKSIGASIVSLQSNIKTRNLLEKSHQQTEELRAQEEEMRQNMEELEATQEAMQRRESDLKGTLHQ